MYTFLTQTTRNLWPCGWVSLETQRVWQEVDIGGKQGSGPTWREACPPDAGMEGCGLALFCSQHVVLGFLTLTRRRRGFPEGSGPHGSKTAEAHICKPRRDRGGRGQHRLTQSWDGQ